MYAYWTTLIAAFLTALYTWRLMFMTFEGNFKGGRKVLEHAHEPPWTIGVPLLILAAGALFAGLGFRHLFIGADQIGFWRDSLVTHEVAHHDLPLWLTLSPTIAMTAGFLIAWYFYMWQPLYPFGLLKRFPATNRFFFHAWYFDALYDFLFVRPANWLGYIPVEVRRRQDYRRARARRCLSAGRRHHQPRGPAPDRLHLPLRLHHADRRGAVHHLFHLRRWGNRAMSYSWPILSTVTFLPLLGALLILALRGNDESAFRNARYIALWTTLITFAISLLLWRDFDMATAQFQFVELRPWLGPITFHMGVDGISMPFVVLTTLLMPITILSTFGAIKMRVKEFMIAFLVLETLMLGVFCSLDLVMFYLFFEGGLIPMFLIIGIWGGSRRVYASFKFFLYTLAGPS